MDSQYAVFHFDVKTMSEHMRLQLFPARVAATVLGAFGLVALMLAAIGLLIANHLGTETGEIAVLKGIQGARGYPF